MLSPILHRVHDVQLAARRLMYLHCTSRLATICLFAFVGLGLIDYALRLHDPVARWLLSAAFLALVGTGFWKLVWPVLRSKQSPVATARRIERRFPELGERLSSAVAFLGETDGDRAAGSRELRRAVIADAEASAAQVDFRAVLDRRAARRAVATVAVALALAAALAAISPATASLAAARLIAPWSRLAWPRKHELAFVNAPTRLAIGGDFEVVLRDRRGDLPDDLQIQIRRQSSVGTTVERRMIKPVGSQAVFRLENVTSAFEYRARGGDDDAMPWTEVALVEPPRILELQVVVHSPSYSGLAEKAEGQIVRALIGSTLEIRGKVDRAIRAASLKAISTSVPPPLVEVAADGRTFRGPVGDDSWIVDRSAEFDLELTEQEGVAFPRSSHIEIRALEDQPPTIAWKAPAEPTFVTTDASLPIQAVVKDDLAVHSIQLRYFRTGKSNEEEVLDLYASVAVQDTSAAAPDASAGSGTEGESKQIDSVLEFSRLTGLSPGDTLMMRVTAEDYKPQFTATPVRRVSVISRADFESRMAMRESAVLAQLGEALRMAQQCREQTEAVEKRLAEAGSVVTNDLNSLAVAQHSLRQVDRLVGRDSAGVAGQITALLADLAANHLDQGARGRRLRELLGQVDVLHAHALPLIDQELMDALKLAREASSEAAPVFDRTECAAAPIDAIVERLRKAREREGEVVEELRRIIGITSQGDRLSRIAHDFSQLHADQERLAADTDDLHFKSLSESDLSPAERSAGQQLGERQLELARRADKLQTNMEALDGGRSPGEEVATTVREALDAARRLAIGGRMREAAAGLSRFRLSQAREVEQGVLDGLAELIALFQSQGEIPDSGDLVQRAQRGGNQAGKEGSTGQSAENEAGSGKGGLQRDGTKRIESGDKQGEAVTDANDALRRVWGHLPDKVREEMRSSFSEQFLPKYERLIEEYYKRLAEERPVGP